MRLALTFIAMVLLTAWHGRVAAQVPDPLDGLDAYIRTAMVEWQIPGLAIAVVKDEDDAVVFVKAYGVRQVGTDERVDEKTLFEYGSATKAFTATALAMMVSEGKLAWDDPITKYVPWLDLADPFVTRHVTIRDLLSHRVADGWGGSAAGFIMFAHEPREVLRALAWRPPPDAPPVRGLPGSPAPLGSRRGAGFRSRFEYENANYYAAAEVILAVSGVPWDEFVRSRIFHPLGMTSAVTSAQDLWKAHAIPACFECGVGDHRVTLADARHPNVAVLHRLGERGPETRPPYVAGGGASGIHGSIADATRWLLFQTARGSIDGSPLLQARLFDDMHAAQVTVARETQQNLRPGAGNMWAHGFGWVLTDYRGRRASFRAGAFTSHTGILPDERLGVMVLANLPNPLREALVLKVFDAFVGAPPRDWAGEMLADARRRAGEARARQAKAAPPAPAAASSLPLTRYVGAYEHPAFGEVFVTHENEALVLRLGRGQIGDLMSLGNNEFRATWRGPERYRSVVTFTARGERVEQLELQFPAATFRRK